MIEKVILRVCIVDYKDPRDSPIYQAVLSFHGPKVANALTKNIVVNMKC